MDTQPTAQRDSLLSLNLRDRVAAQQDANAAVLIASVAVVVREIGLNHFVDPRDGDLLPVRLVQMQGIGINPVARDLATAPRNSREWRP